MNIKFVVIVAPFTDLARRRYKLSAALPIRKNDKKANTSWRDGLTKYFPSYNSGITDHTEYTITYDALKNPTSYYNGSRYDFTWQGRTLTSTVLDGITSSYVYDVDGLRTQKTVGDVVYNYYWNNGQLAAMTITSGTDVDSLMFSYDCEGVPFAMSYNENVYYYLTDIQGNVNGLIDENGRIVAEYAYDAWGVILSESAISEAYTEVMNANPIRYRGYTYDAETKLYYLQSRYYDPVVGRFLNADDVRYLGASGTVLSFNLFSYCENDSINKFDPAGSDAIWLQNSTAVLNLGHTGLLIEYKGWWYYWYWGADAIFGSLKYFGDSIVYRSIILAAASTVLAEAYLVKVCRSSLINSNTELNQILKKITDSIRLYHYNTSINTVEKFDGYIYFDGNFEKGYNSLIKLEKSKRYNLLKNNCMQTCVDALLKGKNLLTHGKCYKYLLNARNMIVPNEAYRYLSRYRNILLGGLI